MKALSFSVAIALGGGALMSLGCSGNDTVPVAGTVTYNSQPLATGRVSFFPEHGGRFAFGEIDNGRFRLTTLEPNDGALPGKHRVIVQCEEPTDPDDAFSDRKPLIPLRYFDAATSGLTAEVTQRGPNQFAFELVD